MNKPSNKTAVILVDMQDFFLKHFPKDILKRLIDNQLKVLRYCKNKNIPLIILEYKAGGKFRGKTTAALSQKIKYISHTVIIKESNSGFTNTNLDQILKTLKVSKIFIMGINANACVQDTAISALYRGYKVSVSKETMGCAWRNDAGLSKRNESWYRENCTLVETVNEAISQIY